MRIPEEIVDALLERWPVARLATIGPDGRPHQVPIVFARCNGRLWSSIDGKPKAPREPRRVANVRQRPRVSLLLDHYDSDWNRLWWIRIDGDAEVRQPATPGEDVEVEAALAALRLKYPQYRDTPVATASPTLLCIRPLRLSSWRAGPEAPRPPGA